MSDDDGGAPAAPRLAGAAVVFRADASHALGLGHVARIAALIEEARACGAEPVALIGGDRAVAPWLRSQGLAGAPRGWTTDETLAAAARPGVRAVVLDGPALTDQLAPALAARGVATLVIDDRGGVAAPVRAIVNHNFDAPALAATYPRAGVRLLGRDYLLLRRAIRAQPRGVCRGEPRGRLRVVITFGGSDPVGATARVLAHVPRGRAVDLVAVLGPGFRDDAALYAAAAAATRAGHTVELVRDPEHPGALLASADAAITAAGGTLGELAYLGCPALAFAIAADQQAPARAQAAAGLIAGGAPWPAGDPTQATADAVRDQIAAFLADDRARCELRGRALATADGHGPRRVLAALAA